MRLNDNSFVKHQAKKAISRIDEIIESGEVPSFISWAEENRYLPPGSSVMHGRFHRSTAPHMVEILERLHPDDPCTHVSLMKSVQAAATTSVLENSIGAYIKYKLGSILSLTASKNLAKIRSSSAIDVLIDNSGLAEYLKPMSQRMKRKTGDNALYKEFSGGIKLVMSSYNTIAEMKSVTYHLILKDEIDEMPAELKDQGDTNQIIEGRTLGLRHFKILNISTPSRMESSQIYKNYMEGDQRKYNVPCPLCGEKQVLVLKGGQYDYGLTFTMEKDTYGNRKMIPETVRYQCKHCKGEFGESKKQWMLDNGIWIPTATPIDKKRHSYHVSGLYSPAAFLSWERICQSFINTDFGKDILKFKDFSINILGEPWTNIEKSSSWETLKQTAENYRLGMIPNGETTKIEEYNGPLILTAGIDVQKDRLEVHIVGFGVSMEKWTIDYKVFHGNPANINDACWTALDNLIYNNSYKILGKDILIARAAIDCGYDPNIDFARKTNTIYDYVGYRSDRFIAVMGIDETKQIGLIQGVRVNDSTLTKRYNIKSSDFKDIIFSNITHYEGARSIHVPKYDNKGNELADHWYKQFVSERFQETSPGKFGWKKIYKRNEVLDTFVYAMAAAEFINISAYTIENWNQYKQEIANYKDD